MELGLSREDMFPVLEGVVAVACHASSPDLPQPGGKGRCGGGLLSLRVCYASRRGARSG